MESYAKVGTLYEVGIQSLGLQIISNCLKVAAAAYLYTGTTKLQSVEIEQSIIFLSGSGLEATIEQCNLPYDANRLRDLFFSWADHQKHFHSSQ